MPDKARAPKRGPWDADVFTVAQGPSECARLVEQGWEVFDKDLIVHEIKTAGPARRAVRQVVAYWWLGRKLSDEDQETRDAVIRQAEEAAADVGAGTPQPEPPDDDPETPVDETDAQQRPTPDPPALPGSRPKRPQGPARRGRAKAPGAVGSLDTEGLRTR